MVKPFLTYDEQIKKLVSEKHLKITDIEYAKAALKNIGYFDDILALYHFDLSLRDLVFKYLCQIECKVRQLISYSFCNKYGDLQSTYLNPNNYNNNPQNASDITRLIQLLTKHATYNMEHE